MSDSQQPAPPALIAEATKRAGLIWIKTAGQAKPRPAWHVWRQQGESGGAYLLTGPGEQPLPELAGAAQVTVLVPSKDSGGLLVCWQARADRVEPGSPEWDAVIGLLVARRLNRTGLGGAGTEVYRLTPAS